jgi:hypothetical protein
MMVVSYPSKALGPQLNNQARMAGPDPCGLSKQFSGCPRSLALGNRDVISRIGMIAR